MTSWPGRVFRPIGVVYLPTSRFADFRLRRCSAFRTQFACCVEADALARPAPGAARGLCPAGALARSVSPGVCCVPCRGLRVPRGQRPAGRWPLILSDLYAPVSAFPFALAAFWSLTSGVQHHVDLRCTAWHLTRKLLCSHCSFVGR